MVVLEHEYDRNRNYINRADLFLSEFTRTNTVPEKRTDKVKI